MRRLCRSFDSVADIIEAMAKSKPINPLYAVAVPVGILFAVTACAYVVMATQTLNPQRAESSGLVKLMEQRGLAILIAELVALAVLTVMAIASDEYWTRRFESRSSGEAATAVTSGPDGSRNEDRA